MSNALLSYCTLLAVLRRYTCCNFLKSCNRAIQLSALAQMLLFSFLLVFSSSLVVVSTRLCSSLLFPNAVLLKYPIMMLSCSTQLSPSGSFLLRKSEKMYVRRLCTYNVTQPCRGLWLHIMDCLLFISSSFSSLLLFALAGSRLQYDNMYNSFTNFLFEK